MTAIKAREKRDPLTAPFSEIGAVIELTARIAGAALIERAIKLLGRRALVGFDISERGDIGLHRNPVLKIGGGLHHIGITGHAGNIERVLAAAVIHGGQTGNRCERLGDLGGSGGDILPLKVPSSSWTIVHPSGVD